MRSVYEEIDAGNYGALGKIAERLAIAAEQTDSFTIQEQVPEVNAQPSSDQVTTDKPAELERPEPDKSKEDRVLTTQVTTSDSENVGVDTPVQQSEIRLVDAPVLGFTSREDTGMKPPNTDTDKAASHQAAMVLAAEAVGPDRPDLFRQDDSPGQAYQQQVVAIEAVRSEYLQPADQPALPTEPIVSHTAEAAIAQADMPPVVMDIAQTAKVAMVSPSPDAIVSFSPVEPDSEAIDEAIDQDSWDDVLELDAPEIYESFTEALQSLLNEVVVISEDTDESPAATVLTAGDDNQVELRPEQESEPMADVVLTIAERLDNASSDIKDAATPVLKEIIATRQEIEVLEPESVEPERIEELLDQLKQQVTLLLEQLGIDYEAEDIEQFIAVLTRPDFQPPAASVEVDTVDLEHEGTREAKIHITQVLNDGLSTLENEVQRILGRLVLIHSAAREFYQLAA